MVPIPWFEREVATDDGHAPTVDVVIGPHQRNSLIHFLWLDVLDFPQPPLDRLVGADAYANSFDGTEWPAQRVVNTQQLRPSCAILRPSTFKHPKRNSLLVRHE